MKLIKKNSIPFFSIIFFLFFYFIDISIESTISATILIIVTLFLVTNKSSYEFEFRNIFGIKKFTYILIIFFTTILLQNHYLNFETIDFDIAAYLVTSQDIGNNNLPNEAQWESKGPLLAYFYYFISIFSGKNLVIFKLINDLLVFLIALSIFLISDTKEKPLYIYSIVGSIFFILLMSQPWGVVEYSELYSLLFISYAFLIHKKNMKNKNKTFFIGFLLGLSTLINQGTVFFIFPYILNYFFEKNEFRNKTTNLLIGASIPHIFFLLIYFFNGLIDIYLTTYLQIPLGYIKSNSVSLYELRVFLRSFYNHIEPVFFSIIVLVSATFFKVIKNFKILKNIEYLNLIFSFIFYYFGSNNYYHHLFFSIYFLTFLFTQLDSKKIMLLFVSFVIIGSLQFIQKYGQDSLNNLNNINNINQNYPIKNLSEEIDSYFDKDYTVLALDRTLVLFYLDKQNYTYIVHPTNHFEEYIVDTLQSVGMIKKDYLSNILLYENPDVILCNQTYGEGIKHSLYNCAVSEYRKEYIQLDTDKYRYDANLDYFFGPYREVNVFLNSKTIKKSMNK